MSRRNPWSPSQASAGATPIAKSKRIPAIARFISFSLRPHPGGSGNRNTFHDRKLRGRDSVPEVFSQATSGNFETLVWPFHFVFHAAREFFDLVRLLDYVQRQDVFVRLIDVGLQFGRELEQLIGISLERGRALLGCFLLHVFHHAVASLLGVGGRIDSMVLRRRELRHCRSGGAHEAEKKDCKNADKDLGSHRETSRSAKVRAAGENYTSQGKKRMNRTNTAGLAWPD